MSYHPEPSTLLASWKDTSLVTSCEASRWYVLRSSENNAVTVAQQLSSFGIQAFTPLEYRASLIGESKVWHQVPSQPDLLFVFATYDTLRSLMGQPEFESLHFVCDTVDATKPLTPSPDEVDNLIRIIQASVPQSYSVSDNEIHYRPGGLVQVTDGPFKGIIGRVARIHTQTRVVVSIPGVISYATTYIPAAFIKRLATSDE